MPDPKTVGERQYGEVQAQEQLKQANPLPKQSLPPVPPVQTTPQVQPEQRQSNPWLIPHKYDGVLGQTRKNQPERMRDAGLLWNVLARSSTNQTIRNIAKALSGEE